MILIKISAKALQTLEDKKNKNLRIKLSENGIKNFQLLKDIFPSEINFLELFGTKMEHDKTIKIITEIIPNSYWKQNAESNN